MINRYSETHNLPKHPARAKGAVTVGCIACGGGAQYSASCYRILRRTAPDLWHHYIVQKRLGEIILTVKYKTPIATTREAIDRMGGLSVIAAERPWVFDFLEIPPRQNYAR